MKGLVNLFVATRCYDALESLITSQSLFECLYKTTYSRKFLKRRAVGQRKMASTVKQSSVIKVKVISILKGQAKLMMSLLEAAVIFSPLSGCVVISRVHLCVLLEYSESFNISNSSPPRPFVLPKASSLPQQTEQREFRHSLFRTLLEAEIEHSWNVSVVEDFLANLND